MTTQPVERLIFKFAVPTIISMLISALYNIVDTFFVGRIDASATAAVGIVFAFMAVVQALGFFIGQGSSNYISRQLGAKNVDQAEKMSSIGFFTGLFVGLIMMVLGFLFLNQIVWALGTTQTIRPYAESYLRVILLGIPFMISSFVMNNQLRLQGNAFQAMIGIATGAILNALLDPVFIFKMKMGISGAALATIISQTISFIILFINTQKSSSVSIKVSQFKPTRQLYILMVQGGMPSLGRQLLSSVIMIVINHAIKSYGDSAMAAMTIVMRVIFLLVAAILGFGQGFQPVCGFNYGAGLYSRVKKAYWFSVKVSVTVLLLMAAASFAFASQIIAQFTNNPDVLAIGTKALRIQLISIPFFGYIGVSSMLLQNINEYKEATIIGAGRQLFILPFIFILPAFFHLMGIFVSQPIADTLTLLLAIPFTTKVLNKFPKEDKPQNAI